MRTGRRAGFGLLALTALAGATACSGQPETIAANTTATTAPVESTTTTELPLTAGKQLSFYAPAVGDCFDRRKLDPKKADEIILKLDCTLPHSNEIFGVVEVPQKDYPGEDILQSLGKEQCPKQFKAYIGTPYETSMYEMGYYTPTLNDWGQGIRHTVGCYAFDAKTKLLGSVKGTAK